MLRLRLFSEPLLSFVLMLTVWEAVTMNMTEETLADFLRRRHRMTMIHSREIFGADNIGLTSFTAVASSVSEDETETTSSELVDPPLSSPARSDFISLLELAGEAKSRRKRAIITWPTGARFVADLYLTIPLRSPQGMTIPFTVDMPYFMPMPTVDLSAYGLPAGRGLDQERWHIFGFVEDLFQKLGLDGRSCVQRAVCEGAEAHVLTNGLLGELLMLLLKISSGADSEELNHYRDAEYHGRHKGECGARYSECPVTVFQLLEE